MAKGLVLQKQSSNPIPLGELGIYVSDTGDVVQINELGSPVANLTQTAISSTPDSVKTSVVNGLATSVAKATAVYMDVNGEFQPVDVADETAFSVFGLTDLAVPGDSSGLIVTSGRLQDITTSAPLGSVLYVNSAGGLIASSELTLNSAPTVGLDGFVAGNLVIRVGIIGKNIIDGNKKDLLVNIQIMGIL